MQKVHFGRLTRFSNGEDYGGCYMISLFYKCLEKGLNNWSHSNNALWISKGSSKEFQWALWKSSLKLVSAFFFSSNNRPSKTMKNAFYFI